LSEECGKKIFQEGSIERGVENLEQKGGGKVKKEKERDSPKINRR